MAQEIFFEYDEDYDEFRLYLDGEDMGLVSTDDLQEECEKVIQQVQEMPEYNTELGETIE